VEETLLNHLENLELDLQQTILENRYMADFIAYKKLNDEFIYFRKYAYEKQPEDCPFPYFTL